jgi:PAS domain S-box-containing protein
MSGGVARSDGWSSYHILGLVEELAQAGSWSTDLETGIDRWSGGMYRILGIEPGSVTPSFQTFSQFVHPDDRLDPEFLQQSMRDGLPIERQFRLIRANGAQRWIDSRMEVVRRDQDRPVRVAGIIVDITAEREAIRARQLADDRRLMLSRALAALIWTTEADGRATGSAPWSELTGQTIAESANFGWVAALHPEDQDRVVTAWRAAIAGEALFEADYRLRGIDGRHRWYNARCAPVRNADGTIREWVGVGTRLSAGDVRQAPVGDPKKRVVSRVPQAAISGPLVRAARALLGWSAPTLAAAAGMSISTLRRIEETNEPVGRRSTSLLALRQVLEQNGVEFAWRVDGQPYIRLADPPAEA